ncbi:MAG: DUF58 domain-containing protein [Spirochaetales bacterium]|nr:DUF58 domain-containing protein [Spirochaetales bacterium]
MIPKELAKKIRYIQIFTTKTVNNVFAGEYESAFKGHGMEFEDVREYQPGDEVRSIDWNVTARTGKPYIKRFIEERELTIMFLVDLSASGTFGSIEKTKNEIAAEICALIAFSAIKNNDKVGLIVFTDVVEMFISPKKGMTHVLRLIRELLYFKPRKAQTNIQEGLAYLGRVMRKKAVVFLVSDFLESDYEKQMRIMGKRHDLIAVSITDPREMTLPPVGLLELEDAETGELIVIDTSDPGIRKQYEKQGKERASGLNKLFRSMGVDQIDIRTDKDYVSTLMRFFLEREKRL